MLLEGGIAPISTPGSAIGSNQVHPALTQGRYFRRPGELEQGTAAALVCLVDFSQYDHDQLHTNLITTLVM